MEWENLPEVGNLTGKKRKREQRERTYVVPDSIIVGDRDRVGLENSLDARQQEVRRAHLLATYTRSRPYPARWF